MIWVKHGYSDILFFKISKPKNVSVSLSLMGHKGPSAYMPISNKKSARQLRSLLVTTYEGLNVIAEYIVANL